MDDAPKDLFVKANYEFDCETGTITSITRHVSWRDEAGELHILTATTDLRAMGRELSLGDPTDELRR